MLFETTLKKTKMYKEDQAVKELKAMSAQYIFQKVAKSDPNQTLIDLQTYFSLSNNLPIPECSSVIYFKVYTRSKM